MPAIRVVGMRSGGADTTSGSDIPGGVVCSGGVPREGVGCAVAHTRDVDHLEGVLEGFLLQIAESCIGDVGQRSVAEDLDQRLVVHGDIEVRAPQYEVATLLQCPGHCESLALDGCIARLRVVGEA